MGGPLPGDSGGIVQTAAASGRRGDERHHGLPVVPLPDEVPHLLRRRGEEAPLVDLNEFGIQQPALEER